MTQDDYERGYSAGYQAGYVQGRLSKQNEIVSSPAKPTPTLEDRPTGNGWIQVTPELQVDFELPEDSQECYVLRDMSGDIIGISGVR